MTEREEDGQVAPAGTPDSRASEVRRHVLSPVERISEVLFGLIMVLSFTGSLSVATAGRDEVKEMFVGAIGCNAAWGIVDAVMYVLSALIERGRGIVLLRAVRDTAPARGRTVIAEALSPEVAAVVRPEQIEELRGQLARAPEPPRFPSLTLQDLRGAIGVFLLVFLSTFPVVLPFAFIPHAHLAMRISNGIAVVMLFFGGFVLGRYAGLRPLRTGLGMVAAGAVLVAITVALGG
jgi:VIT1/CCC1 family predicted Fe2+/Mn2+ transporter